MEDGRLTLVPVELTSDGQRIAVLCEYRDKELVRLVPGRRWNSDQRQWTVPRSWGACVALRGVFGDRLQLGTRLTEWAGAERARRIDPVLALREALDAPGDERLFPFQRAGVAWLRVVEGGLLGDDMGAGKGVQGAYALGQLGAEGLPALVICPKSVMVPWSRELTIWAPSLAVSLVTGSASNRTKALEVQADVYVISWDNVRRHSRLAPYGSIALKHCQECDPEVKGKRATCERCPKELNTLGLKTVIADEAHRMKDPGAKWTRATWAVQHGHEVRYRWAFTGTPVANHPGDLWALEHGVAPGDYPSRTQHVDRYALMSWNAFGGLDIVGVNPQTRDEFFQVLNTRFRRMPKDLVLPHLPKKLYQERILELPKDQRKAYDQMADYLIAEVAEGRVVATNPLAQLTRLMQFASATCGLQEDGQVVMVEPSCKVDALVEDLEALGGEPFVVSAESRLLIDLASARLTREGVAHSLIVGGQSTEQRQRSIDDFQAGRVRGCLFTLKAGGVGLTLTRAGYLIRLQRSYNAIDNRQGEDRVHRIGSEIHDKILIVDYVAESTIEDSSQKLKLFEKSERFEEVVRDRDTLRRLLKGAL